MHAQGTVTEWIERLQDNNPRVAEEAARQIWQRYAHSLLTLARRRLGAAVRRREDEEDVLQSVFKSFCLRQQEGQFEISGRDDLWALLIMLTSRKVATTLRRHGRQRRDFRREEVAGDDNCSTGGTGGRCVAEARDNEPTAEQAVMMRELLDLRLGMLPEGLRQVAIWRLAGYTVAEIAGPDKLDCAARTVERKLQRIRHIWQRNDADSSLLISPRR